MEVSIFTKPDITELLRKVVEIRLHTDKDTEAAARFQALKKRLAASEGNPTYLIVDPSAPDRVIDRFDGADLPQGKRFKAFLEKNAR